MTYDDQNIFAKILRGDIPADVVFEDEDVLAFQDINPAAPTHILVIPKSPYSSFDDFVSNAPPTRVAHFFSTIQKIAEAAGLTNTGYRLVTNHGSDSGQEVPHFHVHLLGGAPLGPLLSS